MIQSPAPGAQPLLGLRGRGRLLLVDRDPLARGAMREGLELAGSFEVSAEAADLEQATLAVALARPDLVLIDVGYPQLDGIAVTEALARADGTLPLVICAAVEDGSDGRALPCRRRRRLSRQGPRPGGAVASAERRARWRGGDLAAPGPPADRGAARAGSRPQRQDQLGREAHAARVAGARADRRWRSASEMAAGLGLARETVRSHVKHVLRKLAVGSRGEAAELAGGLREPPRTALSAR